MKPLGPMDAVWLYLESRDTPMHFATLMAFSPPADAPADYVRSLAERLGAEREVQAPWNRKLPGGPLGRFQPLLVEARELDLTHHFRHTVLPQPVDNRGLDDFIARLHSQPMDMSRPLWECHLIEGLQGGRFAIYTKVHHALLDGTSAMRLLMGTLSSDPDQRDMTPMWTVPPGANGPTRPRGLFGGALGRALDVRGQTSALAGFSRAVLRTVRAATDRADPLAAPYVAPRTMLAGRVNGERRLVIEELELAYVKALAKAADCTVNDLVLYLSGSALRRYLEELGCLPDRSLTAAVPVNVRESPDDQRLGNAASQMYTSLATDIADPIARLEAVKRSTAAGKAHLRTLPTGTQIPYTLLMTAPYIAGLTTGLGGHAPVPYNLNISNVPGPARPLYFNGARMDRFYPVSFLMHGGALCILCTSYDGKLILSLTGAADHPPHLERIPTFMRQALNELAAADNARLQKMTGDGS